MRCLDDRPIFGLLDGFVSLKHIKWHKAKLWQVPIIIFIVLFATLWAMLMCLIYWVTLPFAMINEWSCHNNML